MRPFWPSLFMRFIIVAMSSKSESLFTSCTEVPEPAAMRFLRLALMIRAAALLLRHRADDRGLALQHGVIEIRVLDLLLHLADAGQHAEDARQAAHLA